VYGVCPAKGDSMAEAEDPGAGKIFVVLAVFLVVGVAIVAVMWSAVNEVIAGSLGRLVVALPMLIVFLVFLFVFGRQLQRLESQR
jgi:hypothetical protein